MQLMNQDQATALMDQMGADGRPFLSIIDFEMEKIRVHALDELPADVHYNIGGVASKKSLSTFPKDYIFEKLPEGINSYKEGFELVKKEILYGNSFLLNLSQATRIKTDLSLEQIFDHSAAKYKLLIKDQFVVFSPEPFIKIEDGIISSYPMKGTIDANIPRAEEKLLADEKELAEHYTIVDLIRNDLSIVAKEVEVEQFRFIEKISSNNKELLQASSKITGRLPKNYLSQLGSIIFKLLPAGSISGAPKKKTVSLIQEAEVQKRAYYTGVLALFDGVRLNAGVMIRCIEKRGQELFYRSGGGITHMSNLEAEYQELLDKIYVPIV